MSLEDFLDIRLGDPISALSLTRAGLALGTFIGRLTFYDFGTRSERVISEHSVETIRGLYLGPRNTLYAAIGDRHGLLVSDVAASELELRIVNYERQHSVTDCPYRQTLMWKDVICIVPVEISDYTNFALEGKELYTMNLASMNIITTPGVKFKPYSVVYDFDGYRLLWLESTSSDTKTLKVTSIAPFREESVLDISFRRRITNAKLVNEEIVFIRDFRHIFLVDISGRNVRDELGVSENDILAFDVFLARASLGTFVGEVKIMPYNGGPSPDPPVHVHISNLAIVTVDSSAKVYCWNSRQCDLICDLTTLPELKRKLRPADLFSMGYPYLLQCLDDRIVVTTDLGVFILRSERIQRLLDTT